MTAHCLKLPSPSTREREDIMWYDKEADDLPFFDINVEETDTPFTRVTVKPKIAELICGIREAYPHFSAERIVGQAKHGEGTTVTYDEVRSVLTSE